MNSVVPEPVDFDPFAGGAIDRVISTSEAQREVWLADRLSTQASLAFNESISLALSGNLDQNALKEALCALTLRHDSLRCTIGHEGTELLVGSAIDSDFTFHDLRSLGDSRARETVQQAEVDAVESPFDLERGPLWRTVLFRIADDEYRLVITAHHIVCDGWSSGVIINDLGLLYAEKRGLAPGPPDQAPSYADYLAWEAEEARGTAMSDNERYWLDRFRGTLPILDLPTDRRRAALRSFSSRRIDRVLDGELTTQLRRTGARLGASNFAMLFSAFAATLHRLTGQDDLVIGVPSAGQLASGLTSLVGHCVNLLPIRTTVDPLQGFDTLLKLSAIDLLDGLEHQSLTFGALLKKLPMQRDPSRLPLVSVMFNLDQEAKVDDQCFPGLRVTVSTNPRSFENFELFVNAVPAGAAIRLECQYNTDLFDAITVNRWLQAYEALLRSAASDPSTPVGLLNLLNPNNLEELRALQPPATPVPLADLMHSAFMRQCVATPQRAALSDGTVTVSYADLDQRSNRLARALRARGIRRGERVGICLSRGTEAIMAIIAVLKAGGTYIPMDPGFPPARLAYYAEDANLALLLVDAAGAAAAPSAWRDGAQLRVIRLDRDTEWVHESAERLQSSPLDATAESIAYIIYTSGSTGTPKGVCVPHGAVVNFLDSMRREPGIGPDDILAAVTTLSFDISVLEFMLPLTAGALALIVPTDVAMDGNRLRTLLETNAVTIMQATPSLWRLLLDTPWAGGTSFKVLVGGETCPPDVAQNLLDRVGELWNMYGPTETTIWSTIWRVDRTIMVERGIAIGRPIANTSVWILDPQRQPCPLGVPGEIYIGGAGVAMGYLNRPELTRERFVPDSFHSSRDMALYKTGDRGRWLNSGVLEHLGRLDLQVKIRGYRIELGEIEAQCTRFPGVVDSVAMAREATPGDVRLIAYVVLESSTPFDETALRNHLGAALPGYMIPQHIIVLTAIPSLPNGKIDRKALPAPEMSRQATAGIAPRNDLEREVTKAIETVLNLPGLTVEDDFFSLGGHSLLAARLTSLLNRQFGLNLPLSVIFQAPTAEKLAIAITTAGAASSLKSTPVHHVADRRSAPLTPMQDRVLFIEQLHGNRLVYNTPSAHRLKGPMNVAAFENALQEMVRRQPALRTSIGPAPDGSGYVQNIADSISFPLPVEDLSQIAAPRRDAELMRRMQAIVDTPLNLHEAPLFRASLYRLTDDEYAFLFMPHHIIWDGWSFDLLYEEMSSLYPAYLEKQPDPLPPLTITYGDFAEWYGNWSKTPEFDKQLLYWKQRFVDSPVPAPPRLDYPRRLGMSGQGATEWVHVDTELTRQLRDVARTADATLSMLTLAVYIMLMTSVNNAQSIVIGLPVRGRLLDGADQVMGFFNNLLAVHFTAEAEWPVKKFVEMVKRELIDVFANQEIPFERLAIEPEVTAPSRHVGLYQALFSFQDARDRKRQWGPLEHQSIPIFQKGATEDLGLWLMEVPSGMEGGFTYNTDIYKSDTATAFRERYLELLASLVKDPTVTIGQLTAPGQSHFAHYLLHRESAPFSMTVTATRGSGMEHVHAETGLHPTAISPQGMPQATSLSATEIEMTKIWKDLLRLPNISVTDNFFDIGGYSLLAMDLVARIEARFGKAIKPATLLFAATIRQVSAAVDENIETDSLIPLRRGGDGPAVFFVHDADGATLLYRNLALKLHPRHAVYGLQPHASESHVMLHTRIDEVVDHYVGRIRSVQPRGPYVLGGLCAGGMIAFEIALRLQEAGEEVSTVALIDAADVNAKKAVGFVTRKRFGRVRAFLNVERSDDVAGIAKPVATAIGLGRKLKSAFFYEIISIWSAIELFVQFRTVQLCLDRGWRIPGFARNLSVRKMLSRIETGISGDRKFRGNVALFRATKKLAGDADEPFMDIHQDPLLGWPQRVLGSIVVVDVPAGHSTMLQEPHVQQISDGLQKQIDARRA